MARVAVFCGPAVRRNIEAGASKDLHYEFFPLNTIGRSVPDLRSFDGALVELAPRTGVSAIRTLRRILAEKPVGSTCLRPEGAILKRSMTLGFDFHLTKPSSKLEQRSPSPQQPLKSCQAP